MTEKLYRCSHCGKWSHAQRKPKHHERWVPDNLQGDEPDPVTVIRYEPGGVKPEDDFTGGWYVRCGPFDTWTATREAATA